MEQHPEVATGPFLDKRNSLTGLTPLPDNNYAEHVWSSLSASMRDALWGATSKDRDSYVNYVNGYPRTIRALERRDIARSDLDPHSGVLTERGLALVEWMLWATREGMLQGPGQIWCPHIRSNREKRASQRGGP